MKNTAPHDNYLQVMSEFSKAFSAEGYRMKSCERKLSTFVIEFENIELQRVLKIVLQGLFDYAEWCVEFQFLNLVDYTRFDYLIFLGEKAKVRCAGWKTNAHMSEDTLRIILNNVIAEIRNETGKILTGEEWISTVFDFR